MHSAVLSSCSALFIKTCPQQLVPRVAFLPSFLLGRKEGRNASRVKIDAARQCEFVGYFSKIARNVEIVLDDAERPGKEGEGTFAGDEAA